MSQHGADSSDMFEYNPLSVESAERIKRAIQSRQRAFKRNLDRRITDIQGVIQYMLLETEIKPWAE